MIDGPCLSACTLVLSIVPSNRICVTRRAVLGFHAARSIDRRGRIYAEPQASEVVLEAYPAPVRHWIERHGGLSSHLLAAARTPARSDLSDLPLGLFRLRSGLRNVDHPGDTELVDAHAKSLRPKRFAEGHADRATCGQRIEPAFRLDGVIEL